MFDNYKKTVKDNWANCSEDVKKSTGLQPEVPVDILITNIEVLQTRKSVRVDVVMLDENGNEHEDSFFFSTSGPGRKYLDVFWDVVAPEEDNIRGLIGKQFVGYFKQNGDFRNLTAVSSSPDPFSMEEEDFVEVPEDVSEFPFN